jgi:hypothetical protein
MRNRQTMSGLGVDNIDFFACDQAGAVTYGGADLLGGQLIVLAD